MPIIRKIFVVNLTKQPLAANSHRTFHLVNPSLLRVSGSGSCLLMLPSHKFIAPPPFFSDSQRKNY